MTNADTPREKLFSRFLAEMEKYPPEVMGRTNTNRDLAYTNLMRRMFDTIVIDPTFGLAWDEVPAPTFTNAGGMDAVIRFVKTNGWNMATNDIDVFGEFSSSYPMKELRGLPWTAVRYRKFPAVTHDGVLYVVFEEGHHSFSGVAYNPKTNAFSGRLSGFKPIGGHWYVWAAGDHELPLVQQYEGKEPRINPDAQPLVK